MLSNYEKIKPKILDELQSWMKPNLVNIKFINWNIFLIGQA